MSDKEMILVCKKSLFDGLNAFISLICIADGSKEAAEAAFAASMLTLGFDLKTAKDFADYSEPIRASFSTSKTSAEYANKVVSFIEGAIRGEPYE